jgi:hypothetical protein
MGKILAAELRPNAGVSTELVNFFLAVAVAEGAPQGVACGGEIVQVVTAGQFDGFERELSRHATDHERQMVGRTGRRAEPVQLIGHEGEERLRVEERFGLLIQERFVG